MGRLMLARRLMLVGSALTLAAAIGARVSARPGAAPLAVQLSASPCADARDHDLPLPTSMSPDAFHDRLLAFLQATEYVTLKWCVDKGVRDTGPYVNGTYLGTHPSVSVYYSPAVMKWLVGGRTGDLPDGAMIVKEMYSPARGTLGRPDADAGIVDRDDQGREGIEGRLVLGRPVDQQPADAETERQLQSAVQRARTRASVCRACTATPRRRGS